jgi:two-component system, OmpR family, KDP operon response regulator KdpE
MKNALDEESFIAPASRLLIVEDEPQIVAFLRKGLRDAGYEVEHTHSGAEGLAAARQVDVDLVVLDLCLPDLDGTEVLRRLRAGGSHVPVIVLTARGDTADRVQGLDQGADDYLTKPFGMEELLARIRAALRHQLQVQGERPIFKLGDLSVDLVRRIVKVGGEEVKLSPKEYELLRLLIQHAGKVLTHKFLLKELWSASIDPQYLRVYVRQLRNKIEPDPAQPQYILTETGIGYRLKAPD